MLLEHQEEGIMGKQAIISLKLRKELEKIGQMFFDRVAIRLHPSHPQPNTLIKNIVFLLWKHDFKKNYKIFSDSESNEKF